MNKFISISFFVGALGLWWLMFYLMELIGIYWSIIPTITTIGVCIGVCIRLGGLFWDKL